MHPNQRCASSSGSLLAEGTGEHAYNPNKVFGPILQSSVFEEIDDGDFKSVEGSDEPVVAEPYGGPKMEEPL